mmetsp:Transcript_47368/g.55330  ORF Transcript_47368/g.55330 Transcript_47368/m.55330 type:complete len:128 (+) Transcript_47368:223-606(+)
MFLLYVALDLPFHRTCAQSKIHKPPLPVSVMWLLRYFPNPTTGKNDEDSVPNPQHDFVLITETQCTSMGNRRVIAIHGSALKSDSGIHPMGTSFLSLVIILGKAFPGQIFHKIENLNVPSPCPEVNP